MNRSKGACKEDWMHDEAIAQQQSLAPRRSD
jgi:hypothetical protein